jgi:hypothetical protein
MHYLRIICGDYSDYLPQWLFKTANHALNSSLNHRKRTPFQRKRGRFGFLIISFNRAGKSLSRLPFSGSALRRNG